MRKATFFYLLRRGLLGAGGFVRDGLVMAASKFKLSGITHPAQGSAEFDGSSDYIQLDTPFSYTNHTIAAWVYFNANDSNFFDNRDANDDGIRFELNGSTNLSYSVNASDVIENSFALNEWHFVTGTYDGTTQRLYVDGSQVGSATTSQTISTTTNAKIGRASYTSAALMDGNLSNVAFWNRALSSDEINAVMWKGYQSLTDNEKSGLQAWYSLDDVASPAASLATMEALAVDKDATIENKAAVTAAINALS
jgi:hypothetical protein